MVSELIQKYIWLIQTFIKAGEKGLPLDELCKKWSVRFGSEYARRTFNNHREAIEEIFNIRIECDRSTYRYYIRYSDDINDMDETSAWLINTFTVNDILSLGKERLSGRVSVEDIPSGHKYLTVVMEAMLDCRELRIRYRKYTSYGEESEYTLKPYAVKESARRWYLVAHCAERDAVRVYGMDRIVSLETTGKHFTMPRDFDVDELFATSYGVYLSDEKPCRIFFKASREEAGYMKDLPLHPSQKIESEDEKGIVFSIFVSPNSSLLMDLWRLGSRIEIIAPDSIRALMKKTAAEMIEIYK